MSHLDSISLRFGSRPRRTLLTGAAAILAGAVLGLLYLSVSNGAMTLKAGFGFGQLVISLGEPPSGPNVREDTRQGSP